MVGYYCLSSNVVDMKQGEMAVLAANLGAEVVDKPDGGSSPDVFEENFKELQKWADPKSSKYGTLSMIRERHNGRLGTALKVLFLFLYI